MLFMIKVLWAVMCISMHLPSRLECQQRGLNGNTPFILDNLIGYHRPADILTKALGWFCLERDRGRPSTRVTEIRESSNIASIRKTEVLFKMSTGAAFWNSWSPDLPCLSGLLLMTLSWVGSRVLVPSSPAREEPYREFICPGKMTWSCFCRGNFCCSVTQLCPTLCHPVHYSTPGFCVLPYLLEFC